jgi:hypothetical protein
MTSKDKNLTISLAIENGSITKFFSETVNATTEGALKTIIKTTSEFLNQSGYVPNDKLIFIEEVSEAERVILLAYLDLLRGDFSEESARTLNKYTDYIISKYTRSAGNEN